MENYKMDSLNDKTHWYHTAPYQNLRHNFKINNKCDVVVRITLDTELYDFTEEKEAIYYYHANFKINKNVL